MGPDAEGSENRDAHSNMATRGLGKFCPNHIFEIGEARHFKFRVLIDTQEYLCMHHILHPKGMCDVLRDHFKFWEVSDNISSTVQDRDIVAIEH